MAVSVIRLAQKKVLVQDMPAVEVLARVDTICVDKTGTLTEPGMRVRDVVADRRCGARARRRPRGHGRAARTAPTRRSPPSPSTIPSPGWAVTASVPFSSARKWSAASFDGHGTWLLGAPEILAAGDRRRAAGRRTSRRPTGPGCCCSRGRTGGRRPTTVRGRSTRPRSSSSTSSCARTRPRPSRYFLEQDVTVKVISGDNAATVGAIAQQAGVPGADRPRRRARPAHRHRGARRRRGRRERVRPGHPVAEAADGRRAARPRLDGRDDRRRRQRRARPQERRPRHRDGLRLGRHPRRGPGGAAGQPLVGHAERGRRGPPGPRQHRARVRRLPHQDQLRGDLLPRHRPHRHRVPVPAAPPDDHRRADHRHPRVLPRPHAEHRAVPSRVPAGGCCCSRCRPA